MSLEHLLYINASRLLLEYVYIHKCVNMNLNIILLLN